MQELETDHVITLSGQIDVGAVVKLFDPSEISMGQVL
jgi:hypothetical protein